MHVVTYQLSFVAEASQRFLIDYNPTIGRSTPLNRLCFQSCLAHSFNSADHTNRGVNVSIIKHCT